MRMLLFCRQICMGEILQLTGKLKVILTTCMCESEPHFVLLEFVMMSTFFTAYDHLER